VEGSAGRERHGGRVVTAGKLVTACRDKRRDPDAFRRAMQEADLDFAVSLHYATTDAPVPADVPFGEEAYKDAVEYMITVDGLDTIWSVYDVFNGFGLDIGDWTMLAYIGAVIVEWHDRCGADKGG
jgi:hypothetical protein